MHSSPSKFSGLLAIGLNTNPCSIMLVVDLKLMLHEDRKPVVTGGKIRTEIG